MAQLGSGGTAQPPLQANGYDVFYLLLPRLIPKSQTCRILGDGSFGWVGDAGGEVGGDFEADGDGGLGVAGEKCDDLIGDLDQAHFGGGRVDIDCADEGAGSCCAARCGG